jgi:NAD(P)-dependent dehydrogenase (short-subunit alcohol dehydrogenase family)
MNATTTNPLTLIVGGASGIGAASAARTRAAGTPTVVWDIAGEFDIECDIADPDAVDAALAATTRDHGMPTNLTVCAGIGHSGMLLDVTVDEWDRVMNINTRGPWLVMRAVAAAMIEAEIAGSIVATSSVSARLVDRSMGPYCASKAALSMIIEIAAFEWGVNGIRVNGVAPGVTQTPMLGRAPVESGYLKNVAGRTPLGRLGQADDLAEAIDALHHLGWVTGQILEVDGGLGLYSPIDSFGEMQRLKSR